MYYYVACSSTIFLELAALSASVQMPCIFVRIFDRSDLAWHSIACIQEVKMIAIILVNCRRLCSVLRYKYYIRVCNDFCRYTTGTLVCLNLGLDSGLDTYVM